MEKWSYADLDGITHFFQNPSGGDMLRRFMPILKQIHYTFLKIIAETNIDTGSKTRADAYIINICQYCQSPRAILMFLVSQ